MAKIRLRFLTKTETIAETTERFSFSKTENIGPQKLFTHQDMLKMVCFWRFYEKFGRLWRNLIFKLSSSNIKTMLHQNNVA